MARTWLSLTVELLGGRGEELWPWPGRIFAVGPSHTFMDLADAIDSAFARWDRSHLSLFTLADGRVITDEETGAEMAASVGGPIIAPMDIAAAKVVRTLDPGAEFQFTFDLGDAWTHRCVVGEVKVDPMEVLGIRPGVPMPYWGWGSGVSIPPTAYDWLIDGRRTKFYAAKRQEDVVLPEIPVSGELNLEVDSLTRPSQAVVSVFSRDEIGPNGIPTVDVGKEHDCLLNKPATCILAFSEGVMKLNLSLSEDANLLYFTWAISIFKGKAAQQKGISILLLELSALRQEVKENN